MAANQESTTTATSTTTTPSTAAAESASSLASSDRHGQRRPVDYLCILDFEATCHQGKKPRPQEIIEFPTVLLNVSTGQVVEPEFHLYIRPDVHPNLSDFCTELTGITQSTIDEKGVSLFEALDQHRQWLTSHELIPWHLSGGCNGDNNDSDHQTFLYVTCGDWDLKHCLPSQLAYHGQSSPEASFQSWINIKRTFENKYGGKAKGMTYMLRYLGLQLQGRHHSGIDDCRNITRICQVMLHEGWVPDGPNNR